MPTVVRCGLLFDGTGGPAVEQAELVIEDGRVAAGPSPAGAEVLDLGEFFVMPGFVDAHTHLSIDLARTDQLAQLREPPGKQALRVPRNLERNLRGGTTTMRIMGEEDWLDVHVRDALADGTLVGPRLVIATRGIAAGNGHGRARAGFDGVDEVRRAVRENLAHGADFIKVFATGGFASGSYLRGSAYSGDELRAAVIEAERAGTYVAVHALGGPGLVAAVEAGARSIDHCTLVRDEDIEAMLAHDCFAVGTYSILFHPAGLAGGDAVTARLLEQLATYREMASERIPRVLASGVPFALGTDSMHGFMGEEMQLAMRFGVAPADALVAGTARGAEVLGVAAEVGTLVPGKAADLVALDGNPLDDPTALDRVVTVVRGGKIVVSQPAGAVLAASPN
jgi:imidazolonepropionase-like amidohydrolase